MNTTNVTGDVAFSLYPFYNWESETEVYGFVNLTITIAPKSWLTSILSWFMEDPDSLANLGVTDCLSLLIQSQLQEIVDLCNHDAL